MTAGCCFILLMLIPVNDATVGTVCSVVFHHRNTCFTFHNVMSWRTAMCLSAHFSILCSLLLSRWPQGSSYGNLCEAESLREHTVHTTCQHTNRCMLKLTHIDIHTHTQAHTCTQRGLAEDHWSVKWFCYHVVCVEYIFPSTFSGRFAWWAAGTVCWGVCVFCGSLRLSVVGQEELGGLHKNKMTVSYQICSSHFTLLVGVWQ